MSGAIASSGTSASTLLSSLPGKNSISTKQVPRSSSTASGPINHTPAMGRDVAFRELAANIHIFRLHDVAPAAAGSLLKQHERFASCITHPHVLALSMSPSRFRYILHEN